MILKGLVPAEGGPLGRNFGSILADADFTWFGLTSEEVRWLHAVLRGASPRRGLQCVPCSPLPPQVIARLGHRAAALLPQLVWFSSCKKRNQEQHAVNGNTSSPSAGSPSRSVRPRLSAANDDDLEQTMVIPTTALGGVDDATVRSHGEIEACLECLFTRGRESAGTLVRPEVDT